MPILSNSFAELSLTALLGYGVVFLGIILLMIVVTIMGKIFTAGSKKGCSTRCCTCSRGRSCPKTPGPRYCRRAEAL